MKPSNRQAGVSGAKPGASRLRRSLTYLGLAAGVAVLGGLIYAETRPTSRQRFLQRLDEKADLLVAELRVRPAEIGAHLFQPRRITASAEAVRAHFEAVPLDLLKDLRSLPPDAVAAWAQELKGISGRHRSAIETEAGRMAEYARTSSYGIRTEVAGGRPCMETGGRCYFFDRMMLDDKEIDRWVEAVTRKAAAAR